MSFFKKWGKSPAGKKAKPKDKENAAGDKAPDFEDVEEDFELPPSVAHSRDRNMSISRSGRHKMKTKQRASVIHGDMYAQEATAATAAAAAASRKSSAHSGQISAWPQQAQHTRNSSGSKPMTTSHPQTSMSSGGGYHYNRETVDTATKKLSGSQRMATTPAVM